MKKITLLLIWLAFTCQSCKKGWLDSKTDQSLAVPSTIKDFQALLDNNNIMNIAPGGKELSGAPVYFTEQDWLFVGNADRNAYTWSHDFEYINVKDWENMYQQIFYSNVVLDGLEKIKVKDNNWKAVKGSALFSRSNALFVLAQQYAPLYKLGNLNETPSIPLRLNSDFNIKSVRSTVKQTYDIILSDLITALELLPKTVPYKTRPSLAAGFGLLARVYLSMGEYEKALEYSEKYLEQKSELMDYNNITLTNSRPFPRHNVEVCFDFKITGLSGTQLMNSYILKDFYNLYDTNDLRKIGFFNTTLESGDIRFKGSYDGSSSAFNGIATDEIFLIRAECNARLGNLNKAILDVNNLLRNRFKKINGVSTYVDVVTSSSKEILNRIVLERRKQLLFRGVSWSDLKRLNLEQEYQVTLKRTIEGKTYTLEPNSKNYVFPLPDDIVQSTGMAQYP